MMHLTFNILVFFPAFHELYALVESHHKLKKTITLLGENKNVCVSISRVDIVHQKFWRTEVTCFAFYAFL